MCPTPSSPRSGACLPRRAHFGPLVRACAMMVQRWDLRGQLAVFRSASDRVYVKKTAERGECIDNARRSHRAQESQGAQRTLLLPASGAGSPLVSSSGHATWTYTSASFSGGPSRAGIPCTAGATGAEDWLNKRPAACRSQPRLNIAAHLRPLRLEGLASRSEHCRPDCGSVER